jgi:dethiobiotin synthetase
LWNGAGGWLVPIRADYFVSDLAVEMKVPVLVVALNRLGCLNHTALTVRGIGKHGLPCAGIVLNELPGATDVATATNADILKEIMDVPLLPGLLENMNELPPWVEANDGIRDELLCLSREHMCKQI